ncbi:heme ABC transporter ATP-binding protein [Trueperella bialowiezensis]|uniref:Hemin import ATP-binding protein HmuV n=1 Tax=Trueperella bialowiezensis TaxID=312285 RepID=A0A3S4V6V8_9ACTO|nr:heme ABC transporter ATP-binding protein [Trueperella bialowiezensis]VEI13321.1 Hemin import ATP-binding protein HmuV [Trueperella bialowiezensis]
MDSRPTPSLGGPALGGPAMSGRNLKVELGGKTIIEGIDLEAYSGQILALVGPNGAGKSTLLSALTGDYALSDGEVHIRGEVQSGLSVQELAKIRAVQVQENQLSFAFTASEVVRMGRAAWARTEEEVRDDVVIYSVMADTETTHLAQRTYPTLSGGEKARVTFARTLAQETPIMLLDEPTAAMDIRHQEAVLQLVRQRADDGAAVVIVVHDLSVAAAYADRVMILRDGRLATVGSPREVLTSEILSDVYGYPIDVFDHPRSGELVVVPQRTHQHTQPVELEVSL